MAFPLRGLGLLITRVGLEFQPLDSPSLVVLPVPVVFPSVPVTLNLLVRYALVVPGLPSPLMVPILMSPLLGHLSIKRRDTWVITPIPVIVLRTVPVPLPRTPPPTVDEKDVFGNVRDNVDISLGQYDHLRRRRKYERGGKWDPDLDIHLRPGRHSQNA